MSAFSFLLNLLWILFGGLWMAAGWLIAAILMAITIIGLPWTRAAFNIAAYALLPLGQKVVSRAVYFGREDIGTGPLGVVGNLVWLVLAGWWLALGHLITALILAVTVIGIPFAWAHVKLAGLALWPIGKIIVPRRGHSDTGTGAGAEAHHSTLGSRVDAALTDFFSYPYTPGKAWFGGQRGRNTRTV
jgi:uncharacterized membrane protein YccF (DUF307 family)